MVSVVIVVSVDITIDYNSLPIGYDMQYPGISEIT